MAAPKLPFAIPPGTPMSTLQKLTTEINTRFREVVGHIQQLERALKNLSERVQYGANELRGLYRKLEVNITQSSDYIRNMSRQNEDKFARIDENLISLSHQLRDLQHKACDPKVLNYKKCPIRPVHRAIPKVKKYALRSGSGRKSLVMLDSNSKQVMLSKTLR